jgi:hypothetical protein
LQACKKLEKQIFQAESFEKSGTSSQLKASKHQKLKRTLAYKERRFVCALLQYELVLKPSPEVSYI